MYDSWWFVHLWWPLQPIVIVNEFHPTTYKVSYLTFIRALRLFLMTWTLSPLTTLPILLYMMLVSRSGMFKRLDKT